MARVPIIDVLFSPEALSCSSSRENPFACAEHPDSLVAAMKACGVAKALLAPCKRWQCERHWICGEVQVDEIASYIQAAPDRLAGLAGYNPYCIVESLNQIHSAISLLDMRGVYVPTEPAALSLLDRRMYPLYARCAELAVPVVLQVGTGSANPAQLAEIAKDFPELEIVAAWKGLLDFDLINELAAGYPRLLFAFPASDPAQNTLLAAHLNSSFGTRCMWGSNGLPWLELLDNIHSLHLPETILQSFLNGTAARIFQFLRPAFPPLDSGEPVSIAD